MRRLLRWWKMYSATADRWAEFMRRCGLRSTELNLMLAVDMPFVSSAFLEYLITQARGAPDAVAIVPRGDGGWQPLCAIYRREFADVAEHALAGRTK